MVRASVVAPFRVRNFRFQWPADLAASWCFEMEALILGWYVLVETDSVMLLTLFASLPYMGTLFSPLYGLLGDRFGHRNVLCAMRAIYTALATTLTIFIVAGVLTPLLVFMIAALMGMVRSSDMVMRNALIGETMPSGLLVGAMSFARITSDSARIVGALAGAGVVATLGMGPAYIVVATLYATSLMLTLRISAVRPAAAKPAPGGAAIRALSPWRDLKDVALHVWSEPHLLAAMYLAFVLNLTAFPMVHGWMPYVAREIYHANQAVLGYLLASSAFGALLGSIALSRFGSMIWPGRMMIVFCAMWYIMLLIFAHQLTAASGIPVMVFAGCAQSLCLVPLATMLLRTADVRFRGRVMGVRSMAVYGLPIGLLISGPLISRFGFVMTSSVYCLIGLAFTALIAIRWRSHLWRLDAPANRR